MGPEQQDTRKKVSIVLPYLGNNSETTVKRLRKLFALCYPNVILNIIFQKSRTIAALFRYKDQIEFKCKSHVVYYLKCRCYSKSICAKIMSRSPYLIKHLFSNFTKNILKNILKQNKKKKTK